MPSTMRLGGVAAVLEEVKDAVRKGMAERLNERRHAGYLDVPDAEIESIARIAAQLARTACADGIATAYQLGVDRNVTQAEHDAPTRKVTTTP